MARVELKGIVKRWGTYTGVAGIDLDIADREFLVLLGPSGCGKTTTMRMVAGLDDPSEGTVSIGGKVVNHLEPKDRDVAMVFQSYGLYAHLSVYENIRFPLKVRGVPAAQHRDRVMKAARMVELEPFLDRKPKALSGGQRQRVALARAIVREPNCFLMDEPLSNLDAKLRVTMRSEIRHLQSELNVTTIYVTHDQIEAMTLADRVAVMERGSIRQLGTPKEIYDRPRSLFVAGFIGSPAMNLIPGDVEDGVFTADGVRVETGHAGSRKNVVLGVRAEDMSLCDPSQGQFVKPVYTVELLGDCTLVTQRHGKAMVTAKIAKDVAAAEGEVAGFRAAPGSFHLFDADSGERIETA